MDQLPPILESLRGLQKYHEDRTSSVVIFVQMPENLVMYAGWTTDLDKYVVQMRQKAALRGWRFSDVYYAEMSEKYAPAVATALQRHFKPVMNKVRMRPTASDQKILRALGIG